MQLLENKRCPGVSRSELFSTAELNLKSGDPGYLGICASVFGSCPSVSSHVPSITVLLNDSQHIEDTLRLKTTKTGLQTCLSDGGSARSSDRSTLLHFFCRHHGAHGWIKNKHWPFLIPWLWASDWFVCYRDRLSDVVMTIETRVQCGISSSARRVPIKQRNPLQLASSFFDEANAMRCWTATRRRRWPQFVSQN